MTPAHFAGHTRGATGQSGRAAPSSGAQPYFLYRDAGNGRPACINKNALVSFSINQLPFAPLPWGGSSVGRASRSQCEGRGFDSLPLHQSPISRRFTESQKERKRLKFPKKPTSHRLKPFLDSPHPGRPNRHRVSPTAASSQFWRVAPALPLCASGTSDCARHLASSPFPSMRGATVSRVHARPTPGPGVPRDHRLHVLTSSGWTPL